jgi:hypothetical protein
VNVCNPGFSVDKAARLCAYHYNHWIEGGVCDKVLQNPYGNIVLDCGCGCDHGMDLDCTVEIFLNCHRRIDEVAQVRKSENEMTNSDVSFVGGASDGGDRIMGNGLYLSS